MVRTSTASNKNNNCYIKRCRHRQSSRQTIADSITPQNTIAAVNNETSSRLIEEINQLKTTSRLCMDALHREIDELRSTYEAGFRNRPREYSRPRSRANSCDRYRSPSRPRTGHEQCWYHRRYGANARKYVPPCTAMNTTRSANTPNNAMLIQGNDAGRR